MNLLGDSAADATPLDDTDLAGLRPSWISTRQELNEVEAEGILRARIWAFHHRGTFWYLHPDQLHVLHRRMLGDVWSWAGKLRRRDTNIGVDPLQIPVALRDLCDDTRAQIGDGTRLAYPGDELAVRFHHRLVLIHPYPNGNGRHARLATDLLVRDLDLDEFSWGTTDIAPRGEVRERYLAALHVADRTQDVADLVAFVRS